MDYREFKDKFYLLLDKGDEIIASLTALCEKEQLRAASFEGIGGCDHVEVGIFDPDKKSYVTHVQDGLLELVSLNGNVTRYEDRPYIHAHAVFAYHDEAMRAQTLSGHLLSAQIGLTAEIAVTPVDLPITRKYVDELGIRVWEFDTNP